VERRAQRCREDGREPSTNRGCRHRLVSRSGTAAGGWRQATSGSPLRVDRSEVDAPSTACTSADASLLPGARVLPPRPAPFPPSAPMVSGPSSARHRRRALVHRLSRRRLGPVAQGGEHATDRRRSRRTSNDAVRARDAHGPERVVPGHRGTWPCSTLPRDRRRLDQRCERNQQLVSAEGSPSSHLEVRVDGAVGAPGIEEAGKRRAVSTCRFAHHMTVACRARVSATYASRRYSPAASLDAASLRRLAVAASARPSVGNVEGRRPPSVR